MKRLALVAAVISFVVGLVGGVQLATAARKTDGIVCSVEARGEIVFEAGDVGDADQIRVCRKDASGVYGWGVIALP